MLVETKIRKSTLGSNGKWIDLKNGTGNAATLQAQIEVFDEKSHYGIKGGRISKLFVVEANKGWGNYLYSYDRGLNKDSNDKAVKEFVNEIIRKYN